MFDPLNDGYGRLIGWMLRRKALVLVAMVLASRAAWRASRPRRRASSRARTARSCRLYRPARGRDDERHRRRRARAAADAHARALRLAGGSGRLCGLRRPALRALADARRPGAEPGRDDPERRRAGRRRPREAELRAHLDPASGGSSPASPACSLARRTARSSTCR